jgi:hypothetical protein
VLTKTKFKMKTKLLSVFVIISTLISQIKAQTIADTISIGAGYANQKWYSLQNDEQGSTQSKDNWDIAFEISGFSAAILANNQKANFKVYQSPYTLSNFGILDTTGINTWPTLSNSDTSWAIGAFNQGANTNNSFDLGWGLYDLNTHIVTGDSAYVIKLNASTFKKLKIETLANGIYTFTYSDINGGNLQTATINKTNYAGKNFVYYNMISNTIIDREPTSSSWDLSFGRYISYLQPSNTAYSVVGIQQNKGVKVAQVDNVLNPNTYSNYNAHNFASEINTVGHDWKTFDLSNNAWKISQDTLYFIKSKSGDIWKLQLTGFGGSANGNFIFTKEKLLNVNLDNQQQNKITSLSIYPNPSLGDEVKLIYDIVHPVNKAELIVSDINGHILYQSELINIQGFYQHIIHTSQYAKGLYTICINTDGQTIYKKLIK